MTISEALEELDVSRQGSPDEIREAYRDLVKVWHPDKFQGHARLQAKASEKLKAINEAYELLTQAEAETTSTPPPPRPQRPPPRPPPHPPRPKSSQQSKKAKRGVGWFFVRVVILSVVATVIRVMFSADGDLPPWNVPISRV